MSFYGGRPGKSFTIEKVFPNYKAMYEDAQQQMTNGALDYEAAVPVGSFVMISYGMGGTENVEGGQYQTNKQVDIDFFNEHPELKPGKAIADYNATLWWDAALEGIDYNASVWVKTYTKTGFVYNYVANVGGIIPEIGINGNWWVGLTDTGIRALAREVEFRAVYDIELPPYTLLQREVENEETGEIGIQYGLANLQEQYIFNDLTGEYELVEEGGNYVLVYASTLNGAFSFDEFGNKEEIGYENPNNWTQIHFKEQPVYTQDILQWRYKGDAEWQDLLDITGLTNIFDYMIEAARAAQEANDALADVKKAHEEISATQEDINKVKEDLDSAVTSAEGYATSAKEQYDALVAKLEGVSSITPEQALIELERARGRIDKGESAVNTPFAELGNKLDKFPYQFDLITDMQACPHLSRGDRAFTFGMDEVGDDDSKLFKVFDASLEEDKALLEEIDEDSITDQNPTGDKKIKEQYRLSNGLIAGLLTVFSGKGGGGGTGGGTIGSITTDFETATVKSGDTITINYFWSSPNAGQGTVFVKDSMSSAVIDAINPNINYSLGYKTAQGKGSLIWKPTDGVHRLTFYVIDRGGIFTNEAVVTVTVGGIEIVSAPQDAQNFQSNSQIILNYGVKTIYKTDKVVLHYEIWQNNNIMTELSGEVEAKIAASSVTIPVQIKKSTQDIGKGEFQIKAYAYMKNDPETKTDTVLRNFIIAEQNTIYLSTTFNSDEPQYAMKPFYIPMTLSFSGGSTFTVEGRYSTEAGVAYADKKPLPTAAVEVRAGAFVYPITFAEVGNYYVEFYATGKGIDAVGYSNEIAIEIAEASEQYHLQQESALVLNLSARQGQTNGANKGTWENLVESHRETKGTLIDFNYTSNGWDSQNGIPTGYLYCNSRAYARINCNILQGFSKNDGVTIECVFKAADIGLNQTVFSYALNDTSTQGIFIYKDRATMTIGNEIQNLTARFNTTGVDSANAPVHIAFVLEKPVTGNEKKSGYVKIFINGVLSAAADFPSGLDNYEPVGIRNILLNCDAIEGENRTFGVSKIDAVRVYNIPLSDDEILKNYVYNLRNSDEQTLVWNKNSLDNDELMADNMAHMTFYLNRNQWETMTKDVKHEITVDYHDPNLPEQDITWYNVKTSWQGTSSIAYPVKNFKLKLGKDQNGKKQKFALGNGKCFKENTFCLKADYMDSSHVHNTGNANFIHESGLLTKHSLTPAQCDEVAETVKDFTIAQGMTKGLPEGFAPGKLKTRTTIYGYPIVLYICLETPESAAIEDNPNREYEAPMFWGIYNFNLDKGSTKSFGLYRENQNIDNAVRFQDCTSFEIAANTAYSGGGFRMMKFMKKTNEKVYGWARPNVYYIQDGDAFKVDLDKGNLIEITNAAEDGKVQKIYQELTQTEETKTYKGYYNDNLGVKGYSDINERYKQNSDESFTLDNQGNFVLLYKIDPKTLEIALDDAGLKIELGYYPYWAETMAWSTNVPLDAVKYESKDSWEIQPLPKNKDFYYDYYIQDFELRFPDMDVYLQNINGKESYNKLYYKEYDKLIALVEWVDSHPLRMNGDEVIQEPGPDGKTFTDAFAEHFDKSTVTSYYLMTTLVGLIDNFGKNLMVDTWGYNKDGEQPYIEKKFGDETVYHPVWKYISNWDEDEEVYTDEGEFVYGLMDMTNITQDTDGIPTYKVYASDENYSKRGELIEEDVYFGRIEDDRTTGWYHEIDYTQILWYPHFYDLDSCLGVNNSGVLLFTPSIEMNDTFYIDSVNNVPIPKAPFNTSDSAMWSKFVRGFEKEIAQRFKDLQTENIFTIDRFKEFYFNNIINTMGERWYNHDAMPKYLSREPIKVVINGVAQYRFPNEFISIAYGTDWQRIRTWIQQRMAYMTSMYDRRSDENIGSIEFRGSDVGSAYSFEVETYEPMYMRIIPKNGVPAIYKRVNDFNGRVILDAGMIAAADQEIYIMPASNIKRIREINQHGFSSIKPAYASRLLELNLEGSSALETITWAQQGDIGTDDGSGMGTNLMQKINLKNCSKYNGVIRGDAFPLLTEVDLEGSMANMSFNPKGGIIRTAKLGSSTKEIKIYAHFDLKDLSVELRYPEGIKSGNAQSGHNTRISTFSLIDCPKAELKINYKIPTSDGSGWIVPTGTTERSEMETFISTYGNLALFQDINSIEIDNSLSINPIEDYDGEIVRELKISLSSLERVKVVNSNIDKIAFIANQYSIKNDQGLIISQARASYPGIGGDPTQTDTDYVTAASDGLICDKKITRVELRGPSKESNSAAVFELPWRVHLGTLAGLEQLRFDVGTIAPKPISVDKMSNADLLGITATNRIPKRFELVLPTGSIESAFKVLYINPNIRAIQFTCVRQNATRDDQYTGNHIPAVMRKSYSVPDKEDQKYFAGIDIRGYSGLKMNFKGFINIYGILGMDSIGLGEVISGKDDSLVSYFEDCFKLRQIYRDERGTAKPWDFTDWSANNQIVSLKRFFANCNNLENEYVQGFSGFRGNGLKDASQMFLNCQSISSINFNWPNSGSKLENITNMFEGCTGLTDAKLNIENANGITSLKSLFENCHVLTAPQISLWLMLEGNRTPAMQFVTNISSMFKNCLALTEIDMAAQNWSFNELLNGTSCFEGCESLKTVTSPDYLDMSKTTQLDNMFKNCYALTNIFGNEAGKSWVLYKEGSTETPLSMSGFFSGCATLENIGDMINFDMRRINDVHEMFSGCRVLKGSMLDATNFNNAVVDLSRWQFNNSVNAVSLFQNCESLTGIVLPTMIVNNISSMFNGCSKLTRADLTPLKLDTTIRSFAGLFSGCNVLATIEGYENWDVSQIITINQMFELCSSLINLDLTQWKFSKLVSMDRAFNGCTKLNTIKGLRDIFDNKNISISNTPLKSMENLFSGCNSLLLGADDGNNCDLLNWGKAIVNVGSLQGLFKDCYKLQDLSKVLGDSSPIYFNNEWFGKNKFNNLSNISEFIMNCTGLTMAIVFKDWRLTNASLTTIQGICSGCRELTNFYLTGMNMSLGGLSIGGASNIFTGCANMTNPQLDTSGQLKQNLDISQLRQFEPDGKGLWEQFTSQVMSWIYTFSDTDLPNTDNNEGTIKVSTSQTKASGYNNFETQAIGKYWKVGTN